MERIKNRSMTLLWAGAAISIAEIYTGGLAAPLGFAKGISAILLGHLIGGILLALCGVISFDKRKNAMETVKDTLGEWGVKIVASLNVLQLLGWSAVMIIQGARGINATLGLSYKLSLIIMAIFVFMWSYYFERKSKKINDFAVLTLLILTCLIFFNIDFERIIPTGANVSFITVVELSIAMPVSWIPLIGDYTMRGESRKGVFLSSFFGYFIASSSMYVLGLLITLFTGLDIVQFISSFSVPIVACIIIVLSTVTTTFLDIYSAVESSKQIFKFNSTTRMVAVYCFIGFAISLFFPIVKYESFLLTIGSVFIPVYSIVIIEYFFIKNKGFNKVNIIGVIFAAIGCILYNYFIYQGLYMPTVLILGVISISYYLVARGFKNNKNFKEQRNQG
ncbi:putative hydroxymethylpyrimidine transporter CytX [Clostridium sp. D2Q-11]|uniref:Hydroxymethylpyrimidine transporter CytX n=1 Tax=Anaeromonas frigoriresistens TaxID=2683708 RepID=A0A942Z911_9FIRM|nr:putative hydroxymethylpyrimidine transporter CytX [Anaeromonas frigoriresistens]MBS4538599.1 putative hydroxymethylpyrimidine transporter CytX [Anaeromonas frigoriresistens]